MDKILTSFFHDGINRIIPGFVVIGLYFSQDAEKVFSQFNQQFYFAVVCILLAAWLIGFLIEAGTFNLWRLLRWFCRKNGSEWVCIEKAENCGKIYDKDDYVRLWEVKAQAEGVMSRGLFLIFIVTLICPPNGFIGRKWNTHQWFGVKGLNWWSLVCVIGFGAVWLVSYLKFRKRFRSI